MFVHIWKMDFRTGASVVVPTGIYASKDACDRFAREQVSFLSLLQNGHVETDRGSVPVQQLLANLGFSGVEQQCFEQEVTGEIAVPRPRIVLAGK